MPKNDATWDISPEWTPQERLRLIAQASSDLERLCRRTFIPYGSDGFKALECINPVAWWRSELLECNRKQILNDLAAIRPLAHIGPADAGDVLKALSDEENPDA